MTRNMGPLGPQIRDVLLVSLAGAVKAKVTHPCVPQNLLAPKVEMKVCFPVNHGFPVGSKEPEAQNPARDAPARCGGLSPGRCGHFGWPALAGVDPRGEKPKHPLRGSWPRKDPPTTVFFSCFFFGGGGGLVGFTGTPSESQPFGSPKLQT